MALFSRLVVLVLIVGAAGSALAEDGLRYSCKAKASLKDVATELGLASSYTLEFNSKESLSVFNSDNDGIYNTDLDTKYRPTKANKGFVRYQAPKGADEFLYVIVSPAVQTGKSKGLVKFGVMVDDYHGRVGHFAYNCTLSE